jgi:RNA polymerase sigma factor (sigma-70 family)
VDKVLLEPALKTALHTVRCRIAEDRTDATDVVLLERFFDGRDPEAFEVLLRRHGPMVLGVCRRVLGQVQDAEDAFQATFLILLRKGRRVVLRGTLAGWLYTVAGRVALRARANRARRRDCERQAMRDRPAEDAWEAESRRELRAVVEEELRRLPEKYRAPLLLCELEGRTRQAAARELGWPSGTVASRLARARQRLRQRLGRRGVAVPAGLLGILWGADAAPAVPLALLASARRMAAAFAAGRLAAGGLSVSVLGLAEGVMRTMWLSKFKVVAFVVAAAVALAGSGTLALRAFAPAAPQHEHPAHPGDPVKSEEHTALFDLVDDCSATHVAVADGAWGDPKTWEKGAVPGAGARVVIPKERTVTVAGVHDKDRVDSIRVDGTLRFDPKIDTVLKVVTLVGNVKSTIEMGTDKERIQPDKTARLILGDRGERNDAHRQRDPYDLSGGFLSHGKVRVFGAEYTSHAVPTAVPRKGDTQVSFTAAPKGWKMGDTLLFPGLDRQQDGGSKGRDLGIDPWTGRHLPLGQHQDEERTIRSLSADSKTVTLDRPLDYQHGDVFGYAEAVPVGNLSRNAVVESENTKDISRRGHVMFMHTQDVVIDSVLFRELGRTNVEGELTSPRIKDRKLVAGTDANSIGRYALHFHIRWGVTYKQQPFVVRNSAIVGGPKLGVVNHGGYGLVDDNVAYRVRGSHFFTENGSEIGRFKGNLAVRSGGTDGDDDGVPVPREYAYNHPLNIGHGGHGFWLQGGGVDVTDNVAIGHSYSAFGFFVANNRIVTYGGPQEPNNPLTKGTPWQKLDVFLAENLKDPSLAHGKPFLHTSAVPFHMARCVGLASNIGLRTRGIDRTEFLVLHDKQDLVEDCRFVNNEEGYLLGYSPGRTYLRNTQFIGSDPAREPLHRTGIGDFNHIAGFLTLDNVTIDGYRIGCALPPRGIHVIKGGFINGVRKLVVPTPWGGKVVVEGVKFGHMKGEEPQPILFGTDPMGPWLYGVPPYSNWTRKLQPFEFVYNGRQVYHDDQKPDAVPFDVKDKRWAGNYGTPDHGPLAGKTGRQLWEQYRLAIGGRLAPEGLTPCPDVKGGSFGPDVPFDPPVEWEPSTAYYGGKTYESHFGKSSPDDVRLHPRYLYDPVFVQTGHNPPKGYVAKVRIDGKEYQSEPTDLVAGVNLVPVKTEKLTRYVVIGAPAMVRTYKKDDKGGK